jgi:NDP-sugar pyrophosphorylase family protein
MINIVIPMAGLGSRFANAGFKKPKPFIDILGIPMIKRVIMNLDFENSRFILIGRKEHFEIEKNIVKQLEQEYKNIIFIGIDKLTEGTACTILYAKKYIDNKTPLLIANSDQIVDIEISNFINQCLNNKYDGSILTFEDSERNPKWSFVKKDDLDYVIQVEEKNPISDEATVGIYFFSKGSDFVDAAVQMFIENDRVNNEFYTCPVYNYLIKNEKKIITYKIKQEDMHGIGTPEDLQVYLEKISI